MAVALPVLERLNRGRQLILAYHNVVPDGHAVRGDASLHLHVSAFQRQLDLLMASHRVVSLSLLLRTGVGESDDRLACITFDDAYRGALELALPELQARGLPATIFVAPGLLGTPAFWWDALSRPGSVGLDDETREYALDVLAGEGAAIHAWAQGGGWIRSEAFEWERPATHDELETLVEDGLVTVAPHSWSHPNLTRLVRERVTEEVDRPLAWLRARFGQRMLPVFAYPYGLSSRGVEESVKLAGYEAALRVNGGLVGGRRPNRFSLPRVNVPAGLSPRGFRLRMEGMVPG